MGKGLNARSTVANGAVPTVHNASTYTNWGCRCDECKASWAAMIRARRFVRRDLIKADPSLAEHGNHNTYVNWMCRCEACTQAHVDHRWVQQQRQRRNKAQAAKMGLL